jgi:predicted dehydrogenase
MNVSRRSFLAAGSVAAGSVASLATPAIHARPKEKKYRTALVGTGWWGMNILETAVQLKTAEVVAMCDVDQKQLDPAVEKIETICESRPKKYTDYRDLLEKEKPEIVIVATPDHWHPLITIAAVDAGAHVYVEKPISHTILEGLAMVKAARANDRIVQVGTHRRASPHNISAMEFLRSGKLGKIGAVRAFVHYPGGPGTIADDTEVPAGLDWDMWCGPAPKVPFNPKIHPKGFRRFLDYANGTLGDWGIHWLDQILWWSEEKHPKMVASSGGRFIVEDNTDAPDAQNVVYQFDDFMVSWEHRRFAGNSAERHNIGCYFYGTEGTLHLGWLDGWSFYPRKGHSAEAKIHVEPQLNDPDHQNIKELYIDFLDAIETGRKPICDIEIGHHSTTMSLLGMLSLKLGRSVAWDGEKQTIPNDPEAAALLKREYRGEWTYPEV